jgi:hypothetical protein
MSTRALIAVPVPAGIVNVYHHSDGYPSGLGAILKGSYNSFDAAMSVIHLGSCSGLDTNLTESCFYHRDKKEPWDANMPEVVKDSAGLLESAKERIAEYVYLWDLLNNCWSYCAVNGDKTFRSL